MVSLKRAALFQGWPGLRDFGDRKIAPGGRWTVSAGLPGTGLKKEREGSRDLVAAGPRCGRAVPEGPAPKSRAGSDSCIRKFCSHGGSLPRNEAAKKTGTCRLPFFLICPVPGSAAPVILFFCSFRLCASVFSGPGFIQPWCSSS